jgi:DNA mismatch endonuclease (patch repair protein)
MGIKVRNRIKNYAGRNFKRQRVPDKQTILSRSAQMSKIRSKGTRFEEGFINLLSVAIPNKFITHVRTLKGTPDIVFEKEKVCVFLDSDFWHGWQYPRWKHLLKDEFWREKISNNRQRDARNTRILKRTGWKVTRIWEHQIKSDLDRTLNKIKILMERSKNRD